MKPRTKERLMTAGTVLLICAVGLGTPGCASTPQSRAQRDAQRHFNSICTTDTDCEMHEQFGTTHREAPPKWKLWTSIGLGVVVAGYLYAQRSDSGADQRGIDVRTPGVGCVASGCAQ